MVQALDTVRLQSLDVDVDRAVELALAALALGVVGQPGPSVVKGVDEEQGLGSGESAAGNVGGELPARAGILRGGEQGLDGVLEGEVERLGGEVTQDVGQVSSPEGDDALRLEDPGGAVDHTSVWPVQAALLDHLILGGEVTQD